MTTGPKRSERRPPSRPWTIRIIAVVAVLVVVAALAYTIATGTLFTTTGSR